MDVDISEYEAKINEAYEKKQISTTQKERAKDLLLSLMKEVENGTLNAEDFEKVFNESYAVILEPEDDFKSVHTSGLLDEDTFFHTIYLKHKGKHKPVIVTSKGHIIPIIDNYKKELEEARQLKMKAMIPEEEKYFYFEYEGKQFQFKVEELFFKDSFNVFSVSNKVIDAIENRTYTKEIYDRIKNKIKEYWDHYNLYEFDIVSVVCIITYLLRGINKNFYLILDGKEDTGKSTIQKVIARLQFNGVFGGKGTIPLIVRLTHFLGCNVNQDEFDKLSKDDKKIFTGVLNTGIYPDGTYSLTNMNKRKLKDQITMLYTYSTKTFSTNNLKQFESNFLSRAYILTTARQSKKLKDINDLSEVEEQIFQMLRNELFVYCLFNWKRIKDTIAECKEELEKEDLFGRKTDINSVILGIIKHFKGDYYREVKKHLEEKAGLNLQEKSYTIDNLTMECIAQKFTEKKAVVEITNKDIAQHLQNELDLSDEEKKRKSKSIGWVINNNNLIRTQHNRKRGTKGETKYIIERNVFLDAVKRYGYSSELIKTMQEGEEIPEENILDPKSEEDLLQAIKKNPENNGVEIEEYFNNDLINKCMKQGLIFESPKGTYRIL